MGVKGWGGGREGDDGVATCLMNVNFLGNDYVDTFNIHGFGCCDHFVAVIILFTKRPTRCRTIPNLIDKMTVV